jgi:hypothetical protein
MGSLRDRQPRRQAHALLAGFGPVLRITSMVLETRTKLLNRGRCRTQSRPSRAAKSCNDRRHICDSYAGPGDLNTACLIPATSNFM